MTELVEISPTEGTCAPWCLAVLTLKTRCRMNLPGPLSTPSTTQPRTITSRDCRHYRVWRRFLRRSGPDD